MQSFEFPVEMLGTQASVIHSVCSSPNTCTSEQCLLHVPTLKMELAGLNSKERFLFVFCIISYFCVSTDAEASCKLKAKFNLSGYKDVEKKTVVIGGMFPIHNRLASTDGNTTDAPESSECEGFNFRTFRWTQTMLFAIKEINARDDLLPKTELGYVIYDSCFTISKAVEGTLTFLTGQDEAVPNYRCGDGPPLSALIGAGGSDLSIATARILGLYYFPQKADFNTPPSSALYPATSISLWPWRDWCFILAGPGWVPSQPKTDYGKNGIKRFKELVEEAGVCTSFSETLPKVSSPEAIQRIVKTVLDSTAKIIVVFSSDVDMSLLVEELLLNNVTNRTWIASEAWVTSAAISHHRNILPVLGGTIGFAVRKATIPGLEEHLLQIDPYQDPLTEEFWETAFNCTLNYQKAMRNAQTRGARESGNITSAQDLMYYLKNLRFIVPHTSEEIYFNNGDVEGFYEILNWQSDSEGGVKYQSIGNYNGTVPIDKRLTIDNTSIIWNNEILEMWSCMTSQVALAVGFALVLSSIMGKSALLMLRARAVKAVKNASKKAKAAAAASEQSPDTAVIAPAIPQMNDVDPIHPRTQRAIMIVCTLIQAVGCTVWLMLVPPHPVKNTAAQNIKIILESANGSSASIASTANGNCTTVSTVSLDE
ncbi:Vomeronasal type-2 receptor 1 [Triplophysa tibetana]|uniref:Vomeronasal type-2 receptor 1 n=1 Tax=Triplophysa tibetana TaxID=1572043 RepID=A0A5A9NYZ3_9TELE|nr:Vomeronasal type-2 receptor 1 [Triplophysa tibetana]